ncbi:hypothetical protein [Solibacillus sp. FSL K6-4121]
MAKIRFSNEVRSALALIHFFKNEEIKQSISALRLEIAQAADWLFFTL